MEHLKKDRIPADNNRTTTSSDKVKDLEEKLKKTEDLYLRALADLDNFRKKIGREKEAIKKETRRTLLLEYLEIADNLEKVSNYEGKDIESLIEGVRVIHQQLMNILKKNGVVALDSLGKKFDPRYHEAVGIMETGDLESGTVGLELQKGYLLEDELLRPSRVQVVK